MRGRIVTNKKDLVAFNIRNFPADLLLWIRRRAERKNKSLREYAIGVFMHYRTQADEIEKNNKKTKTNSPQRTEVSKEKAAVPPQQTQASVRKYWTDEKGNKHFAI